MVNVTSQAYIFFCAVIGGMLIAFIYDIFRVKRKLIKTGNIAVNIEDFIYWLITSMVMFLVVCSSNEGQIRGYIFLGILIGVVLYALILSKILVNVMVLIITFILKCIEIVVKAILYPIKIAYKAVIYPCRIVLKGVNKLLLKNKMYVKVLFAKANVLERLVRNMGRKK